DSQACYLPVPLRIEHHMKTVCCNGDPWIFTTAGPFIFFLCIFVGIKYRFLLPLHANTIFTFGNPDTGGTFADTHAGFVFSAIEDVYAIILYDSRRIENVTRLPGDFLFAHWIKEGGVWIRGDNGVHAIRPDEWAQRPVMVYLLC